MTVQDIQNLGIVGAGGAGFPTHVKLDSRPDTVIVNAAECEPLLHKDMELINHYSDAMIKGLQIVLKMTGADQGIIGIKDKHHHEIELLKSKVSGNIRVEEVEDVYPAGDEVTLIQMITGRIVQPGALPITVGCLVQNVETLMNIGLGQVVVDKYISVAGAVENPATLKVPIGTSYREVLSHFTMTTSDYVVRAGGLMMGELEDNLDTPISKRTGALIILPSDHHCVNTYKRYATEHATDLTAKAACDQCNFCTELCPRYLIGQPVRPELAMRNRMFTREDQPMVFAGNLSCCECNLCTMYACPEGLDPRGATVIEKRISREQGLKWSGAEVSEHPMNEYRKVPTRKLMQRLDVVQYKDEGPLSNLNIQPDAVRIPLNEHIGAPSKPVVSVGQTVSRNDLLAEADGKISVPVHASVSGKITQVTTNEIIIKRM